MLLLSAHEKVKFVWWPSRAPLRARGTMAVRAVLWTVKLCASPQPYLSATPGAAARGCWQPPARGWGGREGPVDRWGSLVALRAAERYAASGRRAGRWGASAKSALAVQKWPWGGGGGLDDGKPASSHGGGGGEGGGWGAAVARETEETPKTSRGSAGGGGHGRTARFHATFRSRQGV